jgi:hypothetical protein
MIKLNSIAKFNNLNPQTNADVSKFIPQKIVIVKNISIKAAQEEHSLTNTDCEEDQNLTAVGCEEDRIKYE